MPYRPRTALLTPAAALLTGMAAAALSAQPPAAGPVTVEKVATGEWKDHLRLANGEAEVIISLATGPRVMAYQLKGGANVLHQAGHRLWVAPEDPFLTYAPDTGPLRFEKLPTAGSARLTPAPVRYAPDPLAAHGFKLVTDAKEKAPFGVQKQLDVTLAAKGSTVTVLHRLINVGEQPLDVAAWALTVMAPGGTEIIPLPPRKDHPGGPLNARSGADFAPGLALVLWPYAEFGDPRYTWGKKYILLRQQAGKGPTKIGLAHRQGWVAYHNKGTLFVKRFNYKPGQTYPDFGSNFETFTNSTMLEVETLSPLVKLPPGGIVEHAELWELHPLAPPVNDEAAVDQLVVPLVTKK